MSATTTHHGMPDGMTPFALLDLVEKLKSELGLLDQDITYLRWTFRHVLHDSVFLRPTSPISPTSGRRSGSLDKVPSSFYSPPALRQSAALTNCQN